MYDARVYQVRHAYIIVRRRLRPLLKGRYVPSVFLLFMCNTRFKPILGLHTRRRWQ